MKKKQKQDQAFLFEQIHQKGDLGFDYTDVKSRINVLQYEKSPVIKSQRKSIRPQVPVVACSLLLVTATIGFGGFMMSRREAVTEPDSTVESETISEPESSPHQFPTLYPEDVLLWQGEAYIRTDLAIPKNAVGERLGQVTSKTDSENQHNIRDNPQVAIAEHLEDGTPFHQVKDAEDHIAVFIEGGYIIYQKQPLPDTETP